MEKNWVSTGFKSLDKVIQGLRQGDNVVWQVEEIEYLNKFTQAFLKNSLEDEVRICYIRFADHEPLINKSDMNSECEKLKIYNLKPVGDFESFTRKVYEIISEEGEGINYIFDSLSELLTSWATDLMIGNFFKIICPYLAELNTIAYFGLKNNTHSFEIISDIIETTQVFLNLFYNQQQYCLYPVKVEGRYNSTMFFPHLFEDEEFVAVTDSVSITGIFSDVYNSQEDNASNKLDYWDRLFLKAGNLLQQGNTSQSVLRQFSEKISKFMLTRDEEMLSLVKNNFELADLIKIKSRLIGSGFIGGKSLGMLLARKILQNSDSFNEDILEEHDSFYIGSDVFYSYIVHNGWWKLWVKQKSQSGYFAVAEKLRKNFLQGAFPQQIKIQLQKMLNYYGQSPIIVRSSSLLEDGFGNAFAGKYDSFFRINRGSPSQRLEDFIQAVCRIYASTMSEEALVYRREKDLVHKEEQMAILVQRVSGSNHSHYFFPHIAGVGNSYNNYAWGDNDPESGLLRMVMGLGTRAVNRTERDYPRIVTLDNVAQKIYPSSNKSKYTQRYIDLLNLKENKFETKKISKLLGENINLNKDIMNLIGEKDREANKKLKELGINDEEVWFINYDSFLKNKEFPQLMRKMLKIIEKEYSYPVDIEFTLNFKKELDYKINLLQCRPLQTNINEESQKNFSIDLNNKKLLFKGEKSFMGGNFKIRVKKIVYISPHEYNLLKTSEKYEVARIIGSINSKLPEKSSVLLLGPGRWGTSTPSLGIPINFSEINRVNILGELAHGEMQPEMSFGSHFFQDLIEARIKYLALDTRQEHCIFREKLLLSLDNSLTSYLPEAEAYESVIKIIDLEENHLVITSSTQNGKFFSWFV